MRKIRKLILFTALLIVVLWKYEEVLEVLGYVGHELYRAALVYGKSKKK